jgi:hypothetical protein
MNVLKEVDKVAEKGIAKLPKVMAVGMSSILLIVNGACEQEQVCRDHPVLVTVNKRLCRGRVLSWHESDEHQIVVDVYLMDYG